MKTWGFLFMACMGLISLMVLPKDGLFYRPEHWPAPQYAFEKNPLTTDGFALGRTLFYDPILSIDSTVSCASCHFQYTAFAHVDHPTSHGVASRIGKRNAPGLMNLAWYPSFHWDGGVLDLNGQAINPMTHPDEMGSSLADILVKLNRDPWYRAEFKKVFGINQIKTDHLLKALAQFTVSLVSANSKYDSVMRKESIFTEQEKKGYKLFQRHCNQCHTEPLFTNFKFEANGIGPHPQLLDSGRALITAKAADAYLFRVPTLRNVEHSFPYMHDGRMGKLKEVIKHYASQSSWVEPISKAFTDPSMLQTDEEQKDLLSFLKTLTDKSFLFNPAYRFRNKN
jgi:cytochrome c peroxidase